MTVIPFIGPSYQSRSPPFDTQRSVNLYPVKSETGNSKSTWGLQKTPGLLSFVEFDEFPVRQEWNVNGRFFAVVGNKLYEVFVDKTKTVRGQLDTSTGSADMSDNGGQLIVVDGPDGPGGYVLDLTTDVFTNITSTMGFRGATTVTFIGGYFMLTAPSDGIYYISGLYDGLTYDPLDFAVAEGSPDNLVGVRAVHNQAWLFGSETVEVVYNQGGADFPFASIQGAFIQYGCVAAQSIANTANTIFWLGQDADGGGMVWMATGYQPQRISTHPVEFAIQQYASIDDAIGFTYQEDGHYFYILSFPNANTTWAYDVGEQQWHERAYFSDGVYSRQRQACHTYVYGMHLVGDYALGIIYEQSLEILDDNGQELRWERTSPYTTDPDLDFMYFSAFQLDMQTGTGLGNVAPTVPESPDVDPQVMLQWSNDGGETYTQEFWRSAGKVGEYTKRVLWNRLGRARQRVWRVAGSAAVKVFLIAGHADLERGTN